jgi:hypothetical protein
MTLERRRPRLRCIGRECSVLQAIGPDIAKGIALGTVTFLKIETRSRGRLRS